MKKPTLRSVKMPNNRGDDRQVDGLLSDYFRAEMPDPWPSAPAVVKPVKNGQLVMPNWLIKSRRRLALAASIALFFVSCWGLSSYFPNSSFESKGVTRQGVIGKKLDAPHDLDKDGLNSIRDSHRK